MSIANFKSLTLAVKSLGVSITMLQKRWERNLWEGQEIDNEDLKLIENDSLFFDVSPNGEVKPTVVFIPQTQIYGNKNPDKTDDLHKYHFFKCRTIQKHKRKERYKKSTRLDGRFFYRIFKDDIEYKPESSKEGVPLFLCGNCLSLIGDKFGKYSRKADFELDEFLEQVCNQGGLPNNMLNLQGMDYYSDLGDSPRVYSKEWKKKSQEYRKLRNFTCEKCSIDLSAPENHKWCHVHHMDGDPSNNLIANFKCLCIKCHADQCMHHHIKQLPEYKEFINNAFLKGVIQD